MIDIKKAMELHDEAAEARHVCGATVYNEKSKAARDKLECFLTRGVELTDDEIKVLFISNSTSYYGNYELTPGQALRVARILMAKATGGLVK